LTQQEIANRLGLTRSRVNRLVGQVRSDGLVRIEVDIPLAYYVALEARLTTRYSLDDVTVIPSVPDPECQQQIIGEAAGVVKDLLLQDCMGLGVGRGGRCARPRRLTARRLNGSWVAALMGGLTHGSGTKTFEGASEFAPAVIYCPSPESRGRRRSLPIRLGRGPIRLPMRSIASCSRFGTGSKLQQGPGSKHRDGPEAREEAEVF
jgi:hypothetical protein